MELQHLVVKIPVAGPLGIDPTKVVDVFHQWVAAQSIAGVLLVDVAELLHVPNGPGVVAVGVEAELESIEGADHGFKGADSERADKRMMGFFDRYLK